MNTHDFRRIALSLEGAEESSHMGSPDFRVGGRIFATLAAAKQGYGNIMITPEQQAAAFVEEMPEVFIPVKGGWGRNGATHVRLDRKLRLEKTPRPTKKALRGRNLDPRRADHEKKLAFVLCLFHVTFATRMPAPARNIRRLLHRLAFRAAIFPRRHGAGTNRVRALLALFRCHRRVSF